MASLPTMIFWLLPGIDPDAVAEFVYPVHTSIQNGPRCAVIARNLRAGGVCACV